MALGCLVVALMRVIAQETEIPTQITVQPGTTLTFVMQQGKAVPSEVKATLKTVSLPQEPPMTAYKLPACAPPAPAAPEAPPVSVAHLHRSTAAFVPRLLPALCLLHPAQPSQNRCRSVLQNALPRGVMCGCHTGVQNLPGGIWILSACAVAEAGACRAGLLLCFERLLHLQRTDIIVATDLNTKLVLVLHVPWDFE